MGTVQLSQFYNLLLTSSRDSSIKELEAWKRDLQEDIQASDWEIACFKAQTQSVIKKYRLLQYKWLTHTYHLTPSRLSQMFPDIEKGTLIHRL